MLSSSSPSRSRVLDFLRRFKAKVRDEGIVFIKRQENVHTLAYLGMLTYQAEELILGLAVDDYLRGPMPDDDGSPGEVWEFTVRAHGTNLYIKLKLDDEAKCVSFHPSRNR